MKRISGLFTLLSFSLLFWACNGSSGDCDPDYYCDGYYPSYGDLSIRVTPDQQNPCVPITVYIGQFEEDVVYFNDTICNTSITYSLEVDYYYSVAAKYLRGTDTIVAIDGDKISVSSNDNCGYTCYEVNDANLNLKLLP